MTILSTIGDFRRFENPKKLVGDAGLGAGGIDLDEAIVNYVRRKYGIVIGQVTAEQLKMRIGAAVPQDTENSMEVQGQD